MRKLYILPVFVLMIISAASQQAKMNFALQKELQRQHSPEKEIAVFVKGDAEIIRKKTIELGGVYKYAAGDISAIRLPLSKIPELAAVGEVTRIESNDLKLQPMNDQMTVNNHALEVQNGFNLPQAYRGQGVVIGIIDEGIDYTHPDFRDQFGNTRIKYLWDQSILNSDSATQAQPYGYGKAYTGAQIDTSTQHFDSPFGHGTHVTGIAAGNGNALNNYRGVAPDADLIIVKMNLNQTDNSFLSSLVDAVKYIFDHASMLNEPAVINISLGTYYGSHDGRDIQAQSINNLVSDSTSRVIVCSAGNAGTAPIHLGYNITTDTNFTWFQFASSSIYFQAWADSGSFENARFSLAMERVKPDYSIIASLPFDSVAAQPGTITTDTLTDQSGNRLGIVERLIQNWGDRYSIEYNITPDSIMNINGNDTSLYYWRFMTTGSGRVDAWSFDMVFDNLPDTLTLPGIINYKKPDIEQTIVSSFTCSDKVITVGSYINRNSYTNANFAITRDTSLHPGQLSIFSSHGPTRDGRNKPDITATGEWLLSCGTQLELNILSATEPEKVAAGKKHKRSSGTSMSSPVVAGMAALYLQKNPSANWQDVKSAITGCADQDAFTGSNLPDTKWGHGKINGYSVMLGCHIGIDELNGNLSAEIFPNPTNGNLFVNYDFSKEKYTNAFIVIRNSIGELIYNRQLENNSGDLEISLENIRTGMYFFSISIDGKSSLSKKLAVIR
jgi:subtilisin family serine protease